MPRQPAKKTVLGQPSWRIATPRVEAYVTETGGHLGPVTFDRGGRKIAPFSVAPWVREKLDPATPAIIRVLRGDFFCLPFGGNTTPWRGERHPVHGETANARWSFVSAGRTGDDDGQEFHLRVRPRVRKGQVDKHIVLRDEHDVVYQRHVVAGMSGPMSLGHHAMLRFPDEERCGVISTSPFALGQVFPEPVESPRNRGYSILKPAAEFDSLERVPMITGETTDLSRYPARRGFEDIVMLIADASGNAPFAWTAVAFPKQRYVWFALKDPRVLRGTIFWISNGGRHYAPWNGRHVNVMGLEEVTSYFHGGLAESAADNPFARRGIPTSVILDPKRPLTVNYLTGVAPLPGGFDRVDGIEAETGSIVLRSSNGRKRVRVPVDVDFLGR
jgi:hypothetical protein